MRPLKPNLTILIVDDTSENIEVLAEYLSDYKIKAAPNGMKALEMLNAGLIPDIILLDVMMPKMDGYEACERIKQDPLLRDIPVIFITSMSDVSDKVTGFEVGAVDYITKPFQPKEVISRIEAHIASSLYRRELESMNILLEQKVQERTLELQMAKEKAEEANRLKTHFLSLMSHELRTPMVGILGYSEALMDELQDPMLKEFVVNLNEAAVRLKNTLESILIMTKLESRAVVVHPVRFDLPKHLELLLKGHTMTASLKGLTVGLVNQLNHPEVCLDIVMTDIIINNLVGNAIKYTKNGSVNVELFEERRNDSLYTCIRVADTGIGIPKDKQQIIFEEFRQVYEGMTRNFEGVGLGLSLVKKYVEEMFGLIELESVEGAGSSFTVKFELNDTGEAETVADKPEDAVQKRPRLSNAVKPKFLIVEDDHIVMNITKLFLSEIIDIDSAFDGEQAMHLARENEYSAILMDINLGTGLSGLDVTKKLRQMDKYCETPIIAFTAFALDGDERSFLAEGCTHYLPKPFSKRRLLELINSVI